ncbi:helix-turn-helix domain-containing protein [Nocardiopsis mangrovi]|uniref:Helix-turn-helix domain-containing protein n=1 Tax=Nocardiopsis mangrovi TaxID=1179818 RepID=A0ABV9DVN5_9ACTN
MSANDTPGDGIRQRLTRARKRRALTQYGLAARTSYSRSHIAQVESGHKIPTPAFVAAVASALGLDPTSLYGQPIHTDNVNDDRVHDAIADLRRAISSADVAPDLDAPVRSLGELSRALVNAEELRHAARHVQLGGHLPALIEELTWHAHESEDPAAWTLLNRAHNLAASLTRRLGYTDLAGQIMEQATVSARESQDPHLPLMMTHRRALLMMNVAAWGPAMRLLEKAVGKVDAAKVDAVEVTGSLHLRAAVVSARAGSVSSAWDHYGQAVEASDRAGKPSLDAHGTDFNPGNLAIHRSSIAIELRDFDTAVTTDEVIRRDRVLAGVAPERRAHHEIDMSRVHVETGHADRALKRLLSAERIAPQMTRYHPQARTLVKHMVDAKRALPEELRGIQSRMGV